MTETYTTPAENGKRTKTKTETTPRVRVQVEIVRHYVGDKFIGINDKDKRVLVTVGDPDRVIKMLALAVGTELGVNIYVPAAAVEAF